MPLSQSAVERIFARMLARYGSAWSAKWQGVDVDAVKADWAMELEGVTYDQIIYGLSYLPADWPPTVTWFREQCLRMPEPEVKRLPEPAQPIPENVMAHLKRLADMHEETRKRDPRAWAYRLQEREKSGERLTKFQRDAWREALTTVELPTAGTFFVIDEDKLPLGMRNQARAEVA